MQDTAINTAVETGTVGRETEGDGNYESNPEERYGMFRNVSAKFVWAAYIAAMKGENSEDSDV